MRLSSARTTWALHGTVSRGRFGKCRTRAWLLFVEYSCLVPARRRRTRARGLIFEGVR